MLSNAEFVTEENHKDQINKFSRELIDNILTLRIGRRRRGPNFQLKRRHAA